MTRTLLLRVASAGVAVITTAAVGVTVASAHAVLNAGRFHVAIGWQFEPATGSVTYVDQPNAIQVFIDVPSGSNPVATPVSGLNADTTKPDFQVTATFGNQTSSPLVPLPTYDADTGRGRLDEYDAVLTPTRVGAYKFRIFGTINGTPIDQTVTSGPTTFDSVGDQAATEFPAAVPALSDLGTKIDAVNGRATAAKASATSASNSASGASTLALVALVVAVVLGAANLALGLRRRGT